MRLKRIAALHPEPFRDAREWAKSCKRGLKHVQTGEKRESEPSDVVGVGKHHAGGDHDSRNPKDQCIDVHN
jgi:hypothetical protein